MAHKKERSEETAFKNMINSQTVKLIAQHMLTHYPQFKIQEFLKLQKELAPLELKNRIRLIAAKLNETLPEPYPKALKITHNSLVKPSNKLTPLKGFSAWPLFEFVQLYGHEYPHESLEALRAMTPAFTAEYAVRPYIRLYPKVAYKMLLSWTKDKNEHIRRLASEGSRPRLPWGEILKEAVADPKESFKILDRLIFDQAVYVQKSVANHLNDISKDHPELAIKFAKKWISQADEDNNIAWIIKHGLRGLIKAGNPEALQIFGFGQKFDAKNIKLRLAQETVKIGDSIEFHIEIKTPKAQQILIDYAIHFVKKNGALSKKVFKMTQKELSANTPVVISKKHSFKLITTRTYYTGKHILEIYINGQSMGQQSFSLQL